MVTCWFDLSELLIILMVGSETESQADDGMVPFVEMNKIENMRYNNQHLIQV